MLNLYTVEGSGPGYAVGILLVGASSPQEAYDTACAWGSTRQAYLRHFFLDAVQVLGVQVTGQHTAVLREVIFNGA